MVSTENGASLRLIYDLSQCLTCFDRVEAYTTIYRLFYDEKNRQILSITYVIKFPGIHHTLMRWCMNAAFERRKCLD